MPECKPCFLLSSLAIVIIILNFPLQCVELMKRSAELWCREMGLTAVTSPGWSSGSREIMRRRRGKGSKHKICTPTRRKSILFIFFGPKMVILALFEPKWPKNTPSCFLHYHVWTVDTHETPFCVDNNAQMVSGRLSGGKEVQKLLFLGRKMQWKMGILGSNE